MGTPPYRFGGECKKPLQVLDALTPPPLSPAKNFPEHSEPLKKGTRTQMNHDQMIETPHGKKRWGLIREALELYESKAQPTTEINLVRISVKGGVAELVSKPSEIAVEIYDYDNGEKCVQTYEASEESK